MSKYQDDDALEKYMKKEKKHNKNENSKISQIMRKLDNIETLLLKLTRQPKALCREEIEFVGESTDDDELLPMPLDL